VTSVDDLVEARVCGRKVLETIVDAAFADVG
jgi:hypothetical protein